MLFILNLTFIGYHQSVESVKPATALALLRSFIFLIPPFLLLPKAIGENGIWLSLCLSEFLTAICIPIVFMVRAVKEKRHTMRGDMDYRQAVAHGVWRGKTLEAIDLLYVHQPVGDSRACGRT